ncbi:MAG TPA: suppressor of fused domain protein [Polyangiaceae bacterium]|nr:suppressor of fused domain protein [Polyangiaceae bacterium]
MFLQTGVVLFEEPVSLHAVAAVLAGDFSILRRSERDDQQCYWLGGEGSLLLALGSSLPGGVVIEVFHRPWPDAMGDPEQDAELFGAWTLRHFGVATFPYALARAAAQPSAPSAEHVAFVKLNLSYVFGAADDAPISPPERDVAQELALLAGLAERIGSMSGALAWFAPNGEVLMSVDAARSKLREQASGKPLPELWVSTRVVPAGNHLLVETVGMGALGLSPMAAHDHQVLLPDLGLDMELVVRFLRELSGAARLLGSLQVPHEPRLGPGGRWSPELAESDNPPPREVVRWVHDSVADSRVSVAEMDDAEAERWAEHLHQHLGGEATVFHELLSDTIHLDVLVYAATDERPFHVLVTQGMSALPMTVPDGAEEHRFAELMVALPRDWVLDGDAADEERWYWPMRTLKFVARLPHLHDTWIGLGHTIPNGHPAEPYAEGTELCCVMSGPPLRFSDAMWKCQVAPGKTIRLYALLPLYEDEMNYKLEHGSDALFAKLDERSVDELFDVTRRSVLAKRFWLV